MPEIDPVQFGKLVQSVETLTSEMKDLGGKVETLSAQMTGGKGVIAGLMIAAGGVGASMSEFLKHLVSK